MSRRPIHGIREDVVSIESDGPRQPMRVRSSVSTVEIDNSFESATAAGWNLALEWAQANGWSKPE